MKLQTILTKITKNPENRVTFSNSRTGGIYTYPGEPDVIDAADLEIIFFNWNMNSPAKFSWEDLTAKDWSIVK